MTRTGHTRIHGFSLVELLMSLAILGVLSLVAVPMAQVAQRRQQEHELRVALVQIRAAIDAYKRAAEQGRVQLKLGESGYPASLGVLVDGVVDQRSPTRQRIFFMRRIPADPFAGSGHMNPAETWGLRSYDSTSDDPRAGDDVYDVYSRSTEVGMNGVPYRQW